MFEIELNEGKLFCVETDEFIQGAYHVLLKQGANILSDLHLVPLWPDSDQFLEGDYYQKTFASYPKKNGNGRLLMATLLANLQEAIPNCKNIFSSSWVEANNFDETDFVTEDAAAFWDALIRRELAERQDGIARYKMLL